MEFPQVDDVGAEYTRRAMATGARRPRHARVQSEDALDARVNEEARAGKQNVMWALTAAGFDSCPREGLDEPQVTKRPGSPGAARVVMVIVAGQKGQLRSFLEFTSSARSMSSAADNGGRGLLRISSSLGLLTLGPRGFCAVSWYLFIGK
jgi:hypothetical protein